MRAKRILIIWYYDKIKLAKRMRIRNEIELECRWHSIAFNNWSSLLYKNGYPKKPNGTDMNCWELFDYYYHISGKRGKYYTHAKLNDK
jgi:hypothetical protein